VKANVAKVNSYCWIT